VLATGNAIEIFGREIKDGDRVIPALGIFDFTSVRYMEEDRHNSQYVGLFKAKDGTEITMLGHRSQFSFAYGEFDEPFIDIEIGIGMNPDTKREGLYRNNFFATYSLGPYLIMNPLFTKYLLRLLGLDDTLLFEKEIIEAYEYRRDELRRNLG
jgi:CobQ-like glutamine amidotransferase family enzyme